MPQMKLVDGAVIYKGAQAEAPSLPPVPLSGDQAQKRFNDAVREAIDAMYDGPRRFATASEVPALAGPPVTDTTIPPAPSGLTAMGAFRNILLSWDYAASAVVAYTRVFRNTVDDFETASVIANTEGKVWADAVGNAQGFYYWVANVSRSGIQSPPNGVAGTYAETAPDVDYILDQLEGEILSSHLAESLQSRIDLIDADEATAGSVNERVAAETAARIAALTAEALERTNADQQNASDFNALAAQVRGTYTGTNIDNVTTGLIAQERNARVTQGSALAEQISLLTAGVAGAFDPYKTWYFDGSTEGWTGSAATVTYSSGTIVVNTTGNNGGVTLSGDLAPGVNGGQYNVVRARVKRTAGSGWLGSLRWKTAGHDFGAGNELITLTPDPAIGDWTVLEWNVQETADWTASTILNMQLLLGATSADDFQIDWISVGRNGPGASVASLLAEQQARATADTAEVTARETLSTKLTGVTDPSAATLAGLTSGLIYDERQARSTADATEVSARQSLSAKLTGVNDPTGKTLATLTSGLIYDELTARVSADSAEATSRQALSTAIVGAASPSGKTLGNLTSGLIYDERTARSNADGTITTRIDTLQATYDGQIASVQTSATAVANRVTGLEAQYTIKVDANGRVAGMGLSSNATSSQILMLADKFAIVIPGVQGSAAQVPFVTTTINGVAAVGISSAFIGDAAIVRAKIADAAIDDAKIASLSAAKITFGQMSGARIQAGTLDAGAITTASLVAKLANITDAYIQNANIENLTIGGEKFQLNAVSNCAYMSVGNAGTGGNFPLNTWTDWDASTSTGTTGGGTVSGGGTGGSGGGGIGGGGVGGGGGPIQSGV